MLDGFSIEVEKEEPGTGKYDITFTKVEEERIDKFNKAIYEETKGVSVGAKGVSVGAIGGNISLEIDFTSIGNLVTIKDSITGMEETITDFSNF